MAIPALQQYKVGSYIIGKKLKGEHRYPLVLMLEPLFQCNLACEGCGKIDHTDEVLRKRMPAEEALAAVDECDAPMVSIPGGEPLIHKEIKEIVEGIIARKKFVYLCTNAVLLAKKLDLFTPSPYLTFSIHLDGNRAQHDKSVCQEGVFDKVVNAIMMARSRGFRVNVNCTLFQGEVPKEVADFFDFATELGVDGITVSPGYSYEHAPRQDVFLGRNQSKEMFREIFAIGNERGSKWPISQSALFLDFIAGNQTYECTPWSMPTYNIFGWQRPCYLMEDEGYAPTFQSLMEDTDWASYGTGRNPKCDNCMAHCGYEGSAIEDTFLHPLKAAKVAMTGPRTEGPMAPDLPIRYGNRADATAVKVPIDQIGRRASSNG